MRINRLLPGSMAALAIAAASVAVMGGAAGSTSPQGAAGQRVGSAPSAKVAASGLIPAGATPPAGYIIGSAVFDAANDEQTGGSVACPSGTVPWGGGAKIKSTSLDANLNSSFASGTSWVVHVNNASGSEITFTVYAVCADAPADYQIVNGAVADDPAGTRAGNFAACPTHTVSLGGGGFLDSTETSVNLNGIQPILGEEGYNIEVYVNNASASDTDFHAQVICGTKPKGYTTKTATANNPAGKQSSAVANCPSNRFVVGGGLLSSSIDLASNVKSTAPDGKGAWISSMNNGSASNASVKTYAICVK